MKYLKTYNERLGDKLSAPNDNEIKNKFNNLDKNQKIMYALVYSYIPILKEILNENLNEHELKIIKEGIFFSNKEAIELLLSNNQILNYLSEITIHLLNKYVLNKHITYEIECEKILLKLLKETNYFNSSINNDVIVYEIERDYLTNFKQPRYSLSAKQREKSENVVIFNYEKSDKVFTYDLNILHDFIIYIDLNADEFKLLFKNIVSKFYNIEILKLEWVVMQKLVIE